MTEDDEPKIPEKPRDLAWASFLGDWRGSAEAKFLSQGKSQEQLELDAAEAEARRTEAFRDHFERLAIVSLYIVWFAIVLIGLAWLYHLLAPPTWSRLPDEQAGHLQSIVTGGLIAGIAGGHVKKRIGT